MFTRCNGRTEDIKVTLKQNQVEREELSERINKLDEKTTRFKILNENLINEKSDRMRETLETTVKMLTTQVEKSAKDLERIKYDLHELVEQRTDAMHRMFETELLSVRKRFEEAC